MSDKLPHYLDKWAKILLRENWARQWPVGGILPCEMAFFLGVCEANDVGNIIESGRQDGYSTELIGYYARERRGLAYSVDVEKEPERAERCRRRLSGNPFLAMVKGDARQLIGPLILADRRRPTALLIDGPKMFGAMSLLLAAAGFEHVRVLAMHNVHPTLTPREWATFNSLPGAPHFYEEIREELGESWAELREEEVARRRTLRPDQADESSKLAVMQTCGTNRRSLCLRVQPTRFGLRPPLRYYAGWRLMSAW